MAPHQRVVPIAPPWTSVSSVIAVSDCCMIPLLMLKTALRMEKGKVLGELDLYCFRILTTVTPPTTLWCRVELWGWHWDSLGPGTFCCNAWTWTNISSSNEIQRNYMGLKITACMHSWGKLWTKNKKPNCHLWRAGSKNKVLGAKAGYCACPLHTTPPDGWANHLSHPSSPTPGHTLTFTPYKEPAHTRSGSEQGNLLLVFAPFCTCRSPYKALPEFLVWPLVNFYWLRRPRKLVGISTILKSGPDAAERLLSHQV